MTEKTKADHDGSADVIRQADEEFNKLCALVPGMVYQFTRRPDGTYCVPFTTEAIRGIFGCSPQDVREDFSPIAGAIWPEDFDRVVGSIEYSAKHLTVWTCEYRVRIPGRSTRWILGHSKPEKLADGGITWFGFNTDITERKQLESQQEAALEALRESEGKYRALFEGSLHGLLATDLESRRFVAANPSLCRMFGYSEAELLKLDLEDIHPKDELGPVLSGMKTQLRNGESLVSGIPCLRKDGTVFFADIGGANAIINGRRCLVGFFADVTDRKRAEELSCTQHDLALALSATSSLDAALRLCLAAAIRIAGMDAGGIYLVNETSGDFDLVVDDGLSPAFVAAIAHCPADSAGARLVLAGRPIYARHSDLGIVLDDVRHREGLRASAIIPVLDERRVIACLNLASRTSDETPVFARDALETLAAQMGGAIARLREGQALRESEEKYSTLVEQARVGVTILQDQRIKFANGHMAEMSGYAVDELIGMSAFDLVPPDFAPQLAERFARRARGEDVPDTFFFFLLCKDGTVKEMESSVRLILYEGKTASLALTRDIAERRRAEKNMRILAELNDISPLSIIVHDLQGRFLYANQKTFDLYGYTKEEFRALRRPALDAPSCAKRTEARLQKTMEAGAASFEVEHIRKDGTRFPLEVFVKSTVWGPNKVLLSVAADITERKRMESQREAAIEEVRRKTTELEEKNEDLNRFTRAVAHDLRSPLVTIQTFQAHLEKDLRNGNAARMEKDLGYIRNAADKMSRLLDEIRRFARVGRIVTPFEEASLQEIVQEALNLAAGRITARGVRIQVTEEPVGLYGDRTRLVEVFMNLVDNAVKFMGDEPAPRIEIGAEQAGDETVLFVRDNGIGIDPKLRPMIFGLFQKLDPDSEGEGIGLALVKRIVELHGGRIRVESEGPGRGATFRFTLAKTRRRRAEEEPPKPPGGAR